jgi:hypothetical protein
MTDVAPDIQLDVATAAPETLWALPANELPIGTILPYAPPGLLQLPYGWVLCAGQLIEFPDSPFNGKRVPNLTDGRFLMGTVHGEYLKYGGTNRIETDGLHNHAAHSSDAQIGSRHPHGFQRRGDECRVHDHAITVDAAGGHNHGGENRPAFFGLAYIMRVL